MDVHIPCDFEFLDLNDVEDNQEKNKILTYLNSFNENIRLPWKVHSRPTETEDENVQAYSPDPTQQLQHQPQQQYHQQQQHQLFYQQQQQQQQQFQQPYNPKIVYNNNYYYSSPQHQQYPLPPPPPPQYISSGNPQHFVPNLNHTPHIFAQQGHPPTPPPFRTTEINYEKAPTVQQNGITAVSDSQQPQIQLQYQQPYYPQSQQQQQPQPQSQQQQQQQQLQPQSQQQTSLQPPEMPPQQQTPLQQPEMPPQQQQMSLQQPEISQQQQPQQHQQQTQKLWTTLFKSSNKQSEVREVNGNARKSPIPEEEKNYNNNSNNNNNNNENFCPLKHPKKANLINPLNDPNCYRMGEYLLNHTVECKTISLQPRGLINRSNYCYINSILQALLACPPLYNLLSGLADLNTSHEKQKPTPVIDGMCYFVKQFQHLPAGLRVNRHNKKDHQQQQQQQANLLTIDCDQAFEPSWIYKMLNGVRSDSFVVDGSQEDAEEFLGCVLNGLNDEMLELMKLVKSELSNPSPNENNNASCDQFKNNDEWQVMGPKNKGSVTRRTDIQRTPISDIFGGFLKSRIHRAGDQSTDNIQPFYTLQLNIEKVKTVREALEALVAKNPLEGITSSKTNEEVEAWQQVTLDVLPKILIMHLKCFDFKLNGCTKIMKPLEFPVDLKLDSKLLSAKPSTPKERQYKLFAIVYHDGKEATKGHYITDAFHVGYSSWIRYDDASVRVLPEEQVLNPQGTRVPYLLFYRRCDTIRSK